MGSCVKCLLYKRWLPTRCFQLTVNWLKTFWYFARRGHWWEVVTYKRQLHREVNCIHNQWQIHPGFLKRGCMEWYGNNQRQLQSVIVLLRFLSLRLNDPSDGGGHSINPPSPGSILEIREVKPSSEQVNCMLSLSPAQNTSPNRVVIMTS